MNALKAYLFHIEILKTMSKYTKNEIKQLVNECISVLKEKGGIVQENKIVTFGNKTYPQFGWCVFLAGSGEVEKEMPLIRRFLSVAKQSMLTIGKRYIQS